MSEIFWNYFCAGVFTFASLYVAIFFLVCPVGVMTDNVIKDGRKQAIMLALNSGLPVSYTDRQMSKTLTKPCTYTLGGVVDEMVRSEMIIRTPCLQPSPRWIITRHPQLR